MFTCVTWRGIVENRDTAEVPQQLIRPPATNSRTNLLIGLSLVITIFGSCCIGWGWFSGDGPFNRIAFSVTGDGLAKFPEANLVPPGTQLIGRRLSYDGGRDLAEHHPATTRQAFGATLTSAEVNAFYVAQLTQRGWDRCRISPGEPIPSAWCKGNIFLHVFNADHDANSELGPYYAQFSAVWRVSLWSERRIP